MCGSFSTQHLSWRDIVTLSRLSTNATLPEFPDADRFPMRKKAKAVTKWNTSLIIREQNGVREAVDAAWGLVPFWWSKPLNEKAFDTFNAKVERVKEAKSYRHAIDSQRCLVPASCFYESTGPKGSKTRHQCGIEEQALLLLGLWDYHRHLDLTTFTILTTEPGKHFRRFHHRVAAVAPDSETVDAYFGGNVDDAIELARGSNGDVLARQSARARCCVKRTAPAHAPAPPKRATEARVPRMTRRSVRSRCDLGRGYRRVPAHRAGDE